MLSRSLRGGADGARSGGHDRGPAAHAARTRLGPADRPRPLGPPRPCGGGVGPHYVAGTCFFTTKGDNRVWAYDAVGE
ncbi:hypothetical protein MXD62_14355, partial [Frankia sp. Mgl5]|nr:hypothetical protein [Frankia sp. Mgl5]